MDFKNFNFVDDITGIKPTKKQIQCLIALNPFEKKVTYQMAALALGISKTAVYFRMKSLKSRCPDIYRRFMKLKKFYNKPPYPIQISQLLGINKDGSEEAIDDCWDRLKIKRTF